MNDKFFLDTNIIVYSFEQSSDSKGQVADDLLRRAFLTGKGVISYQVVQEFFNVARRRSQGPMRLEEAEHYLSAVLSPLCTIHSSPALFHKALQLIDRFHVQWYDSLIVAGALEGEC